MTEKLVGKNVRDTTLGGVITIDTNNNQVSITGQLALNSTNIAPSSALQMGGTTSALLLTRMTTTQRDALTAVNGMLIYNSTLGKLQGREGGAWVSLI